MSFLSEIASARRHASYASNLLERVQGDLRGPTNRALIDTARNQIAPAATSAGSRALDAARGERWVGARQIRDAGRAVELLDTAWWRLGSMPDLHGARRALVDAVGLLDRAASPATHRVAS